MPAVRLTDAAQAVPLAGAFRAAQLTCLEITFRTDAAAEGIELAHQAFPDMLVGAGTVLSTAQADAAVEAGAAFIVAPGLNPVVVEHCLQRGIAIIPGVSTPSEIDQAFSRGLRLVKFFPAGVAGGIPFLNAVAGPYPMMRFVPTGGINTMNLADYLSLRNVAACGGTWLARPEALDDADFPAIEALAREAVAITHRVRQTTPRKAGS